MMFIIFHLTTFSLALPFVDHSLDTILICKFLFDIVISWIRISIILIPLFKLVAASKWINQLALWLALSSFMFKKLVCSKNWPLFVNKRSQNKLIQCLLLVSLGFLLFSHVQHYFIQLEILLFPFLYNIMSCWCYCCFSNFKLLSRFSDFC